VIQGHPDARANHFGHALAAAYVEGAEEAGHEVQSIDVAQLDFPVLRSREEWEGETIVEDIRQAQDAIDRARHIVLIYPLWLGTMPALLKAFLEQVLRPGFAIDKSSGGKKWKKGLAGKRARIIITMGMPAFVYRWYFHAHSLKSLERNILGFCGIAPVKESLIGAVEEISSGRREKWLTKIRALGKSGA